MPKSPRPIEVKPSEVKPPSSAWLDEYKLKSQKQRLFLMAYAIAGNVTSAARASNVTAKSHYQWLKEDSPEADVYRQAHEDAKRRACNALEEECWERATRGVKTAKWFNGKIVGYEWMKSDILLIFMMKAAMPDKYRDRVDAKIEGQITLEQIVAASNKFELVPPVAKPAAAGAPPAVTA